MENCKVIVVSGNPHRELRGATVYPHHSQTIRSIEQLIELWKLILHIEKTQDGGAKFDTLIICNGNEAYEWWKDKECETPNGKLKVIERENVGGSFGGYNHAYKFTKYDAFLFTEEDLLIFGDNYYKKISERFDEVENTGFVGLIGVSKYKRYAQHCHGGVGYTRRHILKCTEDDNEELAYHHGEWDQTQAILQGEIPFTNNIKNAGFELIGLEEHQERWCKENFVYPYAMFNEHDLTILGYTHD